MAGIVAGLEAGIAGKRASAAPIPSPLESPTLVPEYFGQVGLVTDGMLLKAGFAERDITPDIGMQLPGDYFPNYLTGFHDPCKVRAAVFDSGTTRVALVGVDSLIIPRNIVTQARKEIQERCGIPPEAILIGAAHNHSGGPVGMVLPGQYDQASSFVQQLAYDQSSLASSGYLQTVTKQIVGAVCEANQNRVEAYCGTASGIEDKVAFSRRFRMKNGLTYTHPGQGNPDVLDYAGETDPQVGVIGAWDKHGRMLGCIVNFTCHATTSPGNGSEISANWIYYMERVIRGSMAAEVPVVFLQGAAGNVTQLDNRSPYAYPQSTPSAEFVGGRVGAEAVKVLLTMVPGRLMPLAVQSKVLHIKRRVPTPEHVRAAYELVKQSPKAVGQTKWVFAKETLLLDSLVKSSPTAEVEIQAMQVGPAVFISNPAELFCHSGLELKARSHFPHTFVVSYANGSVGYVPTEEDLGPHGGGYETRLTSYSNLEVTAAAEIVDAGLQLIEQMQPGAPPTPRKASPFISEPTDTPFSPEPAAWSYGNVPPERD
jgi:hypothetical protein